MPAQHMIKEDVVTEQDLPPSEADGVRVKVSTRRHGGKRKRPRLPPVFVMSWPRTIVRGIDWWSGQTGVDHSEQILCLLLPILIPLAILFM